MNADRLSSLDVAFLSLERPRSPMHLGAVAVFRPTRRVNPIRLIDMLAERAARVPRLRQRARMTWLPLGGAVWSADPGFDPAGHIHLHRLPGPGTRVQLARAVSEAMASPLDLGRPLWEVHLFTGLQDGCFAALTKLHHALADGLRAVGLGAALMDEATAAAGPAGASPGGASPGGASPDSVGCDGGGCGGAGSGGAGSGGAGSGGAGSGGAGGDGLGPGGAGGDGDGPGGAAVPARSPLPWPLPSMLAAARSAGAAVPRPDRLIAPALSTVAGLPAVVRQTGQAAGIAAALLRSAAPPPAHSPWAADTSPDRGLALVRIDLADVHRIRRRHGGTVNDVLLAVVTGALRRWLTGRGTPVDGLSLRALIPVSWPSRCADSAGGNILSGYLCALPVSEPDPLVRLHAVRAEMDRNKTAGPGRGPGALPVLADRLPPAVHRLAGPLAGLGASLLFDTVVTNVPLPNLPLHLAGAEVREVYPVVPLAHGHALGIAVCTYRGTAHLTLHADQQAVPDLARLAGAVPAALSTLDRVSNAS